MLRINATIMEYCEWTTNKRSSESSEELIWKFSSNFAAAFTNNTRDLRWMTYNTYGYT